MTETAFADGTGASAGDVCVALGEIEAQLGQVSAEAFGSRALSAATDAEVVAVLQRAAQVARHAEALMVEATAQANERSSSAAVSERMTTDLGCRSVAELLQRSTRVSSRAATALVQGARAVAEPVAVASGEVLPAEFPAMRSALAAGDVGIDGLVAVTGPLARVVSTAGRAAHLAADEELAASARGDGVDGAPPACADDLRGQATVWARYLDQDGAEPREVVAMRKRGVTLGVARDGVVPLRGNLLAEVAGQLQQIFDSVLNPKVAGSVADSEAVSGPFFAPTTDEPTDFPNGADADRRTAVQKRHDALATALTVAAASGELPTLGGAAPTLVVSVRGEDIASGHGQAHVEGIAEPVTLDVARHIACTGAVQRIVTDARGRIRQIETSDRVFAHHQRRAIALRDGGCIIPGCRVRSSWCEIHHVTEHARGGATHTDNGVLLCWFHHRTIDSVGWKIRMNAGVPEVRGPYWWDATGRWRAPTTSPPQLRDRLQRRVQ